MLDAVTLKEIYKCAFSLIDINIVFVDDIYVYHLHVNVTIF